MATKERVTYRSADDGMLYCGRRSAEYFGAADSILYYYIFTTYDSAVRTWYNDTKAAG